MDLINQAPTHSRFIEKIPKLLPKMKKRAQQSRPSCKNTELVHRLKERNDLLCSKIITPIILSILFSLDISMVGKYNGIKSERRWLQRRTALCGILKKNGKVKKADTERVSGRY
jgi:hypothetical protein